MKIKIGSTIYQSHRGHNNFFYPDKGKPLTLSSSVLADKLQWIGDTSLIAVYSSETVSAIDDEDNYLHIQGPFWVKKQP
jgi:hypothetical protein